MVSEQAPLMYPEIAVHLTETCTHQQVSCQNNEHITLANNILPWISIQNRSKRLISFKRGACTAHISGISTAKKDLRHNQTQVQDFSLAWITISPC